MFDLKLKWNLSAGGHDDVTSKCFRNVQTGHGSNIIQTRGGNVPHKTSSGVSFTTCLRLQRGVLTGRGS